MTKWVGLIVAAFAISSGTAVAQGVYQRGDYGIASDFDAPYAALPPELPLAPLRPRFEGPRYGGPDEDEPRIAPALLPPTAVYGILRDRGYSPLGIPQQRGFVYTISVISPDGDDGRLVIDARSGRILRFLPAYRMGDRMSRDITVSYGPPGAPAPVAALGGVVRDGAPRPPGSVPRVASRTPTVPLPKPMPARAVATPAPSVKPATAAGPAKSPADAQASIPQTASPSVAPPPVATEVKPTTPPVILPTQEMPPAQGFE